LVKSSAALAPLRLLNQALGQVELGLRVTWLEPQRLPKLGNPFSHSALLEQKNAEVVVGLSQAGVGLNGDRVMLDGFV
jgi:hypothetical protein